MGIPRSEFMSHDFGNNFSDGYQSKSYKYEPKWEKDVDYNPDHRRSDSALFIEDRGHDIVWVLQVKGLGVIVLRALDSRSFCGLSEFTKEEIGYAPGL